MWIWIQGQVMHILVYYRMYMYSKFLGGLCTFFFFFCSIFFFFHFRFKCFIIHIIYVYIYLRVHVFSLNISPSVLLLLFSCFWFNIDVNVYVLHYTSAFARIINRPQSVLCVMKIYVIFEINLCLQRSTLFCSFSSLTITHRQTQTQWTVHLQATIHSRCT